MTHMILLSFLLSATLVPCICHRKPMPVLPKLIDDFNIQGDPGMRGDLHGDDATDIRFDSEIANSIRRPKRPRYKKVQALYELQKERLMQEVDDAGDDFMDNTTTVRLNPIYRFISLSFWQRYVYKCCPRAWYYQCRSHQWPMPCFYSYYNNGPEWCCPIWPKVYITRCACCQCAVLLSTCAHEGRCQKRYTMTSFFAVCYRKGWNYIRYIQRYVPTSCYCRIP